MKPKTLQMIDKCISLDAILMGFFVCVGGVFYLFIYLFYSLCCSPDNMYGEPYLEIILICITSVTAEVKSMPLHIRGKYFDTDSYPSF